MRKPHIINRNELDLCWNYKNKLLNLEFRPLTKENVDKVKAIHEYCFPVKYGQRFYDQLMDPKGVYTTRLVFEKDTDELVIVGTGRVEQTKEDNCIKGYVAT
eukprot:UN15913